MKAIFLSLVLNACFVFAYGQTHTTLTDRAGYWNDGTIWSSGTAPTQSVSSVTIVESTAAAAKDGARVVIPGSLNSGNLAVTDRLTVNGFW
ncbi:hypothetical protein [Cesiribacter andamanensis]|uniref:hypothetical protein n=1 Tax=Cesiribacter andamanensis TaxID=649507 RepID=UPI0013786EBC|nr:hypothetical protein [Cesiribacter andamanensis]